MDHGLTNAHLEQRVCAFFFFSVTGGLIWPVAHGLLTHNLNNKLYVFPNARTVIKHTFFGIHLGIKRYLNRFHKEAFGSHLKEKILARRNRIAKGREMCSSIACGGTERVKRTMNCVTKSS